MNETARIKMLGNHREYEVGHEYDVPVDEANALSGMGLAVIVPPAAEEE